MTEQARNNVQPRSAEVPAKTRRALEEMATNDAIESVPLVHQVRQVRGFLVWTHITIERAGKSVGGRVVDTYNWWAADVHETGGWDTSYNSVNQQSMDHPTPLSAYQAAVRALHAADTSA